MKKIFSYIFIAALLFPLFGHVSAATSTSQAVIATPDQKTLISAASEIYNRLTDLSSQTQLAITQVTSAGIATDNAELDLLNANTSLAKAKTIIDKLTPQTDPTVFKTMLADTESNLKDARTNILTSLSDLKNDLPAIANSNNQ